MKLKKALTLVLTVCIAMLFCGCDIINTNDELVSPPALTGDMSPIAKALYKTAGSELDLKYPAAGDHRSAIVLEDINGDSHFEAFAFYSTSDDEMTTMHINAVCQIDGEWQSVADQTIVATGVEMIDFCDLNADGAKEILVGWDVNGASEKQLSVFTFDGNNLTQKLLQPYTGFLCNDLDNNGSFEVFVHHLNTIDRINMATVCNFVDDTITQTSSCVMDSTVKSASAPVLATLSNGQKAIYIDEIKGVGAVTEVLYLSKGALVNPLLDNTGSFENILTLRAASLSTRDINGDSILEIPVASELPNAVAEGEKLYYTNWCSFNGEVLAVKLVTVVNTVDGYYLSVPNNMVGKIAVIKDIENHEREFYYYDTKTQIAGDFLFEITVISEKEWDSKDFSRGSLTELSRVNNTVFVLNIGEMAKQFGIDAKTIKDTFKVIT